MICFGCKAPGQINFDPFCSESCADAWTQRVVGKLPVEECMEIMIACMEAVELGHRRAASAAETKASGREIAMAMRAGAL